MHYFSYERQTVKFWSLNPFFSMEGKKQGNLGDMRKIHVTWQFFEAGGPQGHSFIKTKRPFIRICGAGELVDQISGPYRFSFGQEA